MYFIVQRNLVKAVIPISSHDNGTSPRTHHHCRSKRSREKSLVPTLRERLAKAKQHLHLFENLTFVDGNSDYGHIVALHIAKSRIHKIEDNPPLWFKEQFEQSFNDLDHIFV